MTPNEMQTLLRNLDHRTARMEQFLPTLVTKDESATAIARLATGAKLAEAVALLATKTDLAEAIAPLATKTDLAEAIAPLATKGELASGLDEVRRHTSVLIEDVRDDIRLLAEHLATVLDRRSGHH